MRPAGFPVVSRLRTGAEATIRLLEITDAPGLLAFYRGLPMEERMFLKDDVTTPAGCTIAGILALEDGRIRSVLSRAVEVASVRAGELASRK